jgi:hypothetical protein
MKLGVMILAGMLLVASAVPASAQDDYATRALYNPGPYTHLNVRCVVCNFESGLRSGNDGVVESTLSHVLWLRLVRPDVNLDRLQDEIAGLVTDGRTPSIRYRASLATMVLESPALFAGMTGKSYSTANELFAGVSSTAQQTLLGYNK